MKAHILGFFITIASFIAATYLLPGLNYGGNQDTLIRAAVVLALLNTFAKPVISLLLMPINFLTLGLLGGVTGIVVLYLVTILVPGFSITDSNFPGVSYGSFSIPAYQVNGVLTAILGASLIGFISTVFYWLIG